MEILIIILALLLCLGGIIGCVVPGLPGPPVNYGALLLIHFFVEPVSSTALIILGIFTGLVLLLDYLFPAWFAKKHGATKAGIIGSLIGMVFGMFFTPVGMIMGTLLGAIIGDLLAGRTEKQAMKSGIATFFGTLLSVGLKIINAGVITIYVVYAIVRVIGNW